MTTLSDLALIKDGLVSVVARNPVQAASFGAEPDGEIVAFDPADQVCAGMLWDGQTLSEPEPEEG